MSYEGYFALNVVMNALILWISARQAQNTCPPRIWLAAVLGGIYAMLAQNLPTLSTWAAVWSLAWLMTAVAQPYRGAIAFARSSMLMVCLAMLFGGVGLTLKQWLDGWLLCVVCAAIGWLLTRWLLSARKRSMHATQIDVSLDGIALRAIIDTGNALKEPISQCPVMVVEAAKLGDVSQYKCRKVAFTSVGGDGYLQCFKPEKLMVKTEDKWIQVMDIWVALYEGDLGGRAIAPPEITETLWRRNLKCGGVPFGKSLFDRKTHVGGNAL